MTKDKGILESLVLVIVAGILLVPYVILGMIEMNDGLKMVIIILTAIPFLLIYVTLMFRLIAWSDRRHADRLQKEAKIPIRKCPFCSEIMYVHPIKDADNRWVFYCFHCELLANEEELKQILGRER